MKRGLAALVVLLLAGCNSARVTTQGPVPAAASPPPTGIVVTDFLIDAGDVRLDSSPGSRVLRAADGTPVPAAQAKAALDARDALMQALVAKLATYGLTATREPDGSAVAAGTLLVRGDIGAVDEGNRLRRLMIGFGAGQSRVLAHAQLFTIGPDGAQHFLEAMTATADSGRMPGGAATMGAGAAAQTVAVSGAAHAAGEAREGPDAEAARIGEALAERIGRYAVARGWIAAGAVP
jgi:hypothetical protein